MDNKWYMAGTEETGGYAVLLASDLGRLGIREFFPGEYRIRFEPTGICEMKTVEPYFENSRFAWKEPGVSQPRYSTVVEGECATCVLAETITALSGSNLVENPDLPSWADAIVTEAKLMNRPDYEMIQVLRQFSDSMTSQEAMDMAKSGANGNFAKIQEMLVGLSVMAEHTLDELGAPRTE